MTHLIRLGGLLAGVLVVVVVLLQVVPAPAVLEEFGFHTSNPEANAEEWASLPAQYVGSAVCVDCHEDKYTMWGRSNHQTVNCETCHGPAAAHVETGAPETVVESSRDLCSLCHAALVSRPGNFPQVDMEEMGNGAECIKCHDPHEPRAGMPKQVPHELEGRSNCQTCHRPHEPWERTPPIPPHPLEGRENCLECHGPDELRGATLPRVPHSLEGRSECLLCHNAEGIKPPPEDHAGRKTISCLNCHRTE